MEETKEIIFKSIVIIAWNWDSEGIASIGEIANRTELSKYTIRKHIKDFIEKGFLDKGVRSGGFNEFSYKPYPPRKGYKLTDYSKQLQLYKETKAEEDRRFAEAFDGW